jgi:hypothetical protein
MFFLTPLDIILLLPALAFSLYAQHKVKSAFQEMQKVSSTSGLTGAGAAERLLRGNGLNEVTVEETGGQLSDHYDPRSRTLRLSSGVYRSTSLAALGVAAHETGHALQHKQGYGPLGLRNMIFPVVRFGSSLWLPLFIVGLIMSVPALVDAGIILFAGAVAFHVITLPVEFNASKRAMVMLEQYGFLNGRELQGAKKVLDAAALTYVAAAAMAALQLIRLLILRDAD